MSDHHDGSQYGKSKKIVVAKGFVNAKNTCNHANFNLIKSGLYKYIICRTCGMNMGEVE